MQVAGQSVEVQGRRCSGRVQLWRRRVQGRQVGRRRRTRGFSARANQRGRWVLCPYKVRAGAGGGGAGGSTGSPPSPAAPSLSALAPGISSHSRYVRPLQVLGTALRDPFQALSPRKISGPSDFARRAPPPAGESTPRSPPAAPALAHSGRSPRCEHTSLRFF